MARDCGGRGYTRRTPSPHPLHPTPYTPYTFYTPDTSYTPYTPQQAAACWTRRWRGTPTCPCWWATSRSRSTSRPSRHVPAHSATRIHPPRPPTRSYLDCMVVHTPKRAHTHARAYAHTLAGGRVLVRPPTCSHARTHARSARARARTTMHHTSYTIHYNLCARPLILHAFRPPFPPICVCSTPHHTTPHHTTIQ